MLLKRCVDIALSSLVLLLLSPISDGSSSGSLAGFWITHPISSRTRGAEIPPLSYPEVPNHADPERRTNGDGRRR